MRPGKENLLQRDIQTMLRSTTFHCKVVEAISLYELKDRFDKGVQTAASHMQTEPSAEAAQHLLAAGAVLAGRNGARQKPALHQLDQHALNQVFAELEPKALARAGLQQHSAYQPNCPHKISRALRQGRRGTTCDAGTLQVTGGLLESTLLAIHVHVIAAKCVSDAGCVCRALRTAAENEQLWEQLCTARWKHPNKHLQRAGARASSAV